MKSLLIQATDEASKGAAYKIGYEIGFFVGSHFYETAAVAILITGVIIYLSFFRKKKDKLEI